MQKYAINGRFIVRKQTGQERFASELIRELDKLDLKDEFVLIVPEYAQNIPQYEHIRVVKYGKVKSHFWEQISFFRYIKKHNLISINLTTTCPLFSPDIVCLHDAAVYEIHDLLTQNVYGKLSTAWHKMMCYVAQKRAKRILTVSEYSKKRLMHYLQIPSEKISVVYNAWQHFNNVEPDESIFSQIPQSIQKKKYFMALSSLTPQKNFMWIKEVAKRNPTCQFVICGSSEGFTKMGESELKESNLHFTGYISDAQIKALMMECRAFIHPAIYEGFGIPPLEALACGAELILSNAACLPEIYGESAHYINPYDYEVDLEKIMQEPTKHVEETLAKYNWKTEAKKLLSIVRDVDCCV